MTWAGSSSLEVLIQLTSRRPNSTAADGHWDHVGSAHFVMVARDKRNGTRGTVPPLTPQSAADVTLFEAGARRDAQRRRKRAATEHWEPPSSGEMAALQAAVASMVAARGRLSCNEHDRTVEGQTAAPAPRPVLLSSTALSNVALMHKQDRNQFHRIFGGHLLRMGYELAFTVAARHAGAFCEPLSMDDTSFHAAVPIGCMLRFEAKVVHAAGAVLRVHVTATRMDDGLAMVTNELWFSFLATNGPVALVVPETLAEGLTEYLPAARQHAEDVGRPRL